MYTFIKKNRAYNISYVKLDGQILAATDRADVEVLLVLLAVVLDGAGLAYALVQAGREEVEQIRDTLKADDASLAVVWNKNSARTIRT